MVTIVCPHMCGGAFAKTLCVRTNRSAAPLFHNGYHTHNKKLCILNYKNRGEQVHPYALADSPATLLVVYYSPYYG